MVSVESSLKRRYRLRNDPRIRRRTLQRRSLLCGIMATLTAVSSSSCRALPERQSASSEASAPVQPGTPAQPSAPVLSSTAAAASVGGQPSAPGAQSAGGRAGASAVTKALPEAVLNSVVGCWQLAEIERWSIERTADGGARVVRTLLEAQDRPAYAKRAARPAVILFDTTQQTLAFSTAGPEHALEFAFTVYDQELRGTWGASHAPGAPYHSTPGRAVLHRCAGTAHAAPH